MTHQPVQGASARQLGPDESHGDGPPERARRAGRLLGIWCAVPLLAVVSVVVGFRLADSDGPTPVPQLLAFLPWLLVPAAVAVLCALLARWWPGVVWGAVALGLLGWALQPYGSGTQATGAPIAELRVLTSNVEFGRAAGSLVPEIRRYRPDLVFVEECEFTCQATLERDFADAYPHRWAVQAPGSIGSIILSRYPLHGNAGVRGTMGMPGAVADVHGHDVRLQLAHPMPPLPGQLDLWHTELGRLRDFAAADRHTPTILAGDFNASQDHTGFRRILDTGLRDTARLAGHGRAASWPSRTAAVIGAQIDHVLVSPDFSARDARFLHLDDTDHRALLVDITLRKRS